MGAHVTAAVRREEVIRNNRTALTALTEGNFSAPKLCRLKIIVPFYKINPIGRARQ